MWVRDVSELEWNVVVSTHAEGYRAARAALRDFGRVWRTDYFNVLVMKVDDIASFLEDMSRLAAINPRLMKEVARIAPAAAAFDFESAPEFERKLHEAALSRIAELAGKSFHSRMHRRGLRQVISSRDEEQSLNRALLDALASAGTPGSLDFADPDAIVAVETVGHRAGVSLWSRDDLRKYPFLKAD